MKKTYLDEFLDSGLIDEGPPTEKDKRIKSYYPFLVLDDDEDANKEDRSNSSNLTRFDHISQHSKIIPSHKDTRKLVRTRDFGP